MSERWERIQTLFDEVLALAPTERGAFLQSTCGLETELRDEVASLLAFHDRADTAASLPAEWLSSLAGPRPPRFVAGQRVGGRYRIEGQLGEGGMGEVYEAWDDELSIRVALKTLHGIEDGRTDLQRLKLEGLMARSVWHPNVCRVYDVSHDGTGKATVWFLTMELLRGEPLSKLLQRAGRLPLDRALRLAEQMAAGLGAAHRAGVVHRDFKPSNVVLVSGDDGEQAMVTDFGTARAFEAEHHDRAIVGTPAYMAPEQVRGEEVSPSADIYSFGVVLFEMVTGTLPFDGGSPIEVARLRLVEDPLPPRSVVPDLDHRWERVLLKALARDPAQRFGRVQEVVEALTGDTRIEESGTAEVSPPRHTLPAEHDPFAGRDRELEQLETHLAGPSRLVTLMGTGGMGKTRLAVHYGWQSLSRWPGGVWFCDLTEARDLNSIAAAVASALGIQVRSGDLVEQIGRAIAGRGLCLVILDNFEQVVAEARRTVGRWREQATGARFVVTSRERLDLNDERVQTVEPLPIEDGIELFIARARGLRPALELAGAEAEAVREIVRLVDGMPLAIELAGCRMRVMNAVQIAGQMRKRFALLTGGRGAHHETLRGTIDDSWELMHPWERAAWAQCAVFEGGFTLEAAEAVLDLHPWPDLWVVDLLQALVDKSLLRTSAAAGPIPQPRFGMYVSLQEYARMKLHQEDGLASGCGGASAERATEERHAGWYAQYGTVEAVMALDRHGGVGRRLALQRELTNLIAACKRALKWDDGDTAATLHRGYWGVVGNTGPFELAVELGMEVLGSTRLSPAERANVLAILGRAEKMVGRLEMACSYSESALIAQRECGNRRGECAVLEDLGMIFRQQGRLPEALRHLEEGLAISREIGERLAEGRLWDSLGILYRHEGRVDEARVAFEASLVIHREVGNRRWEGITLGNLAIVHYDHGRLDEAKTALEAGLAIAQEIGSRTSEGLILGNLGNLHHDQGRWDEARRHYEAALMVNREVGQRRLEGANLCDLGILYRATGRWEEARASLEAALAIQREIGALFSEGVAVAELGLLHEERGCLREARDRYDSALALLRKAKYRRYEGIVLWRMGRLLTRQGRTEEAQEALASGESILREVDERVEIAKLVCFRAELECERGDLAAARRLLEEVEAMAVPFGLTSESELGRVIATIRDRLDPLARR